MKLHVDSSSSGAQARGYQSSDGIGSVIAMVLLMLLLMLMLLLLLMLSRLELHVDWSCMQIGVACRLELHVDWSCM